MRGWKKKFFEGIFLLNVKFLNRISIENLNPVDGEKYDSKCLEKRKLNALLGLLDYQDFDSRIEKEFASNPLS